MWGFERQFSEQYFVLSIYYAELSSVTDVPTAICLVLMKYFLASCNMTSVVMKATIQMIISFRELVYPSLFLINFILMSTNVCYKGQVTYSISISKVNDRLFFSSKNFNSYE